MHAQILTALLLLVTLACESTSQERQDKKFVPAVNQGEEVTQQAGSAAHPLPGSSATCLAEDTCPSSATPGAKKDPSEDWSTLCNELARGLVCTEEYAPHTCRLGSYEAHAENPCFAKNALKKKICNDSAFTLKVAEISCSPNLSSNHADVSLWQTSCDKRHTTICTAEHRPSQCTLATWSAKGSNACHARKALLDVVCAVFVDANQLKHAESYKLDSINCTVSF